MLQCGCQARFVLAAGKLDVLDSLATELEGPYQGKLGDAAVHEVIQWPMQCSFRYIGAVERGLVQ